MLGLLLLALAAPVPQDREVVLGPARPVVAEPFTRVAAIHELPEGRLLVLDVLEPRVVLVDVVRHSARRLGRLGAGPGEYVLPTRLLPLGGDSVAIADEGTGRLLVVTARGTLGGVLGRTGRPVGEVPARGLGAPEAADGCGFFYAANLAGFLATGRDAIDSAPIERWRLGAVRRDTVAWLPLQPLEDRLLLPDRGERAFRVEPQWMVGPAGQVAILRPSPYRVDLVGVDGRRHPGPTLPYARIPVSQRHREEWLAWARTPRVVTITRPGAGAAAEVGLRPRPVYEPVHWPAVLPPFLDDAGRFDPEGMLWIRRTTAAGAAPAYDLLDGRGARRARVTAPPGTRLVGFGHQAVYLVRVDADGEEWLERAPRPAGLAPEPH